MRNEVVLGGRSLTLPTRFAGRTGSGRSWLSRSLPAALHQSRRPRSSDRRRDLLLRRHRILETGDWLVPKSSPFEDAPFLEKPPLKFWIIAAGIKSGLLPHNEFGLRFWDALFGSVAFFYVFLIGRRLAGPICGVTAVLILFIHAPLSSSTGCAATTWRPRCCSAIAAPSITTWRGPLPTRAADSVGGTRSRWPLFVLGFMVKFVAALFLPSSSPQRVSCCLPAGLVL